MALHLHRGLSEQTELTKSQEGPLDNSRVEPQLGWQGPLTDWCRGPLLGCGAFGSVNLALCRQTGHLFAVKSVDADRSPDRLLALENEAELLREVCSPRIVRYLGSNWSFEEGAKKRNLMVEHVPGGSVSDLMKNFGGKLGEPLVRQFTRGLVEGLRDLHSLGVVHCDVKGKNILIGNEGVKLCDLGSAHRILPRDALDIESKNAPAGDTSTVLLSVAATSASARSSNSRSAAVQQESRRALGKEGAATEEAQAGWQRMIGNKTCNPRTSRLRGTICWMSPEAVSKGVYGTAGDIWSVGCTIVEMASGQAPWAGQVSDAYSALYKIGCSQDLPTFPSNLSCEGQDFLRLCLRRDFSQRPSAEELLRHPFLTQPCQPTLSPFASLHSLAGFDQSKVDGVDSPTSVLVGATWESSELTSVRCAFDHGFEDGTSASKLTDQLCSSCPCSPHLSSFPSFRKLAAASAGTGKQIRPRVDIGSLASSQSMAEMARNDGQGKEAWCWWASPGSPTAAQGNWLVVHSPKSSRNASPRNSLPQSPRSHSDFIKGQNAPLFGPNFRSDLQMDVNALSFSLSEQLSPEIFTHGIESTRAIRQDGTSLRQDLTERTLSAAAVDSTSHSGAGLLYRGNLLPGSRGESQGLEGADLAAANLTIPGDCLVTLPSGQRGAGKEIQGHEGGTSGTMNNTVGHERQLVKCEAHREPDLQSGMAGNIQQLQMESTAIHPRTVEHS